jgi:uncharacterized protein YpuA (DUF1002 family)
LWFAWYGCQFNYENITTGISSQKQGYNSIKLLSNKFLNENQPSKVSINSERKQHIMQRIYLVFLLVILIPSLLLAQIGRVVSYGSDLTPEEQIVVFRDFPLPQDLQPGQIKSLKVTNEEEWSLLKGLVPDEQIGTQAISSVYVEKLTGGEGIKVQTKNLTYITPHILANALATSGVADAKVFATAPRPVSGTAALTGIYKCFEELTHQSLSAFAKRIAAQEMIETSALGEKSGKEQSALFMERVKERVITGRTNTKPEVIKIIQQTAREQNLKIANEDQTRLADLLLKIEGLNLNLAKLQSQLKNYRQAQETKPSPAPQSFMSKIIAFLQSLFKQLFSFVGRVFTSPSQ